MNSHLPEYARLIHRDKRYQRRLQGHNTVSVLVVTSHLYEDILGGPSIGCTVDRDGHYDETPLPSVIGHLLR